MSERVKSSAPAGRGDKVDQRIWWEPEDWALIEEGQPLLAAETHVDVSPTAFVRAAVRRLHAALVKANAA